MKSTTGIIIKILAGAIFGFIFSLFTFLIMVLIYGSSILFAFFALPFVILLFTIMGAFIGLIVAIITKDKVNI